MKNKIISSDYLLLLLFLNNNKEINGTTRLMKMMFIFNKEILKKISNSNFIEKNEDSFEAYKFGPFSKDIFEQIEFFRSIDFIEIKSKNKFEQMSMLDNFDEIALQEMNEENNYDDENDIFKIDSTNGMLIFKIKNKGMSYVKDKIIPEFKNKINSISIKKLLYYVYTKYPEYTDKSLIKEEVLKYYDK